VALTDTTLLALGRDAFLGLSMRHPQILMAINRVLGDRLARANALLRAASADE
jgi:CRP-like cAMP-binding protein